MRILMLWALAALSVGAVEARPMQANEGRVPIAEYKFRNATRGACLKRAFPQAMVVLRDESLRGPGVTQSAIDQKCPRR